METEKHDEVELDLSFTDVEDKPPEFCRYRDEGCELADSCLHCPFVKCIYDEPGGKQHWLKRLRAREMSRLFTTEGKGIKELAVIFGVSQRTVQRVLKAAKGSARGFCHIKGIPLPGRERKERKQER